MHRVKIVRKESRNPLFEQWISEWKSEAASNGSDNLKFLYGKALRSIQKYPFSLKSGKECVILENFGPKLCTMIDKKLEEYRKTLTEVEWNELVCPVVDVPPAKSPVKKRKSNGANKVSNSLSKDTSLELDIYVPKYRSGGYAILLALLSCNDMCGAIDKKDLIKEAQKFCDASFTKSTAGSFYTAWSSMATLISKNLVSKAGRPLRYQLTEKGKSLAEKLSTLTEEDIEISLAPTPPPSPLAISRGSSASASCRTSETNSSQTINNSSDYGSSSTQCTIPDTSTSPLHLDLLTEPFTNATKSDEASTSSRIQPKKNLSFRSNQTSTLSKQVDSCMLSQLRTETISTSSYSRFYDKPSTSSAIYSSLFSESTMDHVSKEPSKKSELLFNGSSIQRRRSRSVRSEIASNLLPQSASTVEAIESSACKNSELDFNSFYRDRIIPESSRLEFTSSSTCSGLSLNKNSESDTCGSSSQKSMAGPSKESSQETSEDHETIFLFPKKFKIILLVDIHETEMKGKQRSDATLKELEKRGILCESRHLTVGDFACVAQDSQGNELVLPFIVERKRMDDLASSIKDGRFHEQKFRLRGCGVPNVIYLVEKYGTANQRLGLPLPSLQQATVNSQIVDNFIVKVSDNHSDSMLYLSCLTKFIIKLFEDKTLMSCSSPAGVIDLTTDLVALMKFKQFNKASTKNKNLTVKDMLLKQLLQIKGMSVDKALAITDRYSTLPDLITALEQNGEKAIADLKYSTVRKIGPSLALTIKQLYTKRDFS